MNERVDRVYLLVVDMRTKRPEFAGIKKTLDKVSNNTTQVFYTDPTGCAFVFVSNLDAPQIWGRFEGALEGGHAAIVQLGSSWCVAKDSTMSRWLRKYDDLLR